MWIYLIQGISFGLAAASQPGGFYICFISALMFMIFIFSTAAKIGPKINRVLLGVSAIALFFFGLYQLWQGIFK